MSVGEPERRHADFLRRLRNFFQATSSAATRNYRQARANRQPNVFLHKPEYIGHLVRITTDSDGWQFGGTIEIGAQSRLSDFSTIDSYGGHINIGLHFYIGRYSLIQGYGDVSIGNNVMIGPTTSIIASSHTFADLHRPMRYQPVDARPVSIDDDVWIGAGARILGGVTIGRGAVVGAGSVVTSDIGEGEIRAGVPARLINTRL